MKTIVTLIFAVNFLFLATIFFEWVEYRTTPQEPVVIESLEYLPCPNCLAEEPEPESEPEPIEPEPELETHFEALLKKRNFVLAHRVGIDAMQSLIIDDYLVKNADRFESVEEFQKDFVEFMTFSAALSPEQIERYVEYWDDSLEIRDERQELNRHNEATEMALTAKLLGMPEEILDTLYWAYYGNDRVLLLQTMTHEQLKTMGTYFNQTEQ